MSQCPALGNVKVDWSSLGMYLDDKTPFRAETKHLSLSLQAIWATNTKSLGIQAVHYRLNLFRQDTCFLSLSLLHLIITTSVTCFKKNKLYAQSRAPL